ncbi:MAG: DUF1232 domain-containing protein [Methanobrevibacter sp. CfCl-M3]
MDYKFKDFYHVLLENLDSFDGEYASFIDNGPKLFKLLLDILEDEKLTKQSRLEISAAIAYYAVPLDIIPEITYGPYGYTDDIYLTCYVLKKIAKEYDDEILKKYWFFDEDLIDIMDECFNKSKEILEEDQFEKILKYVGLC